jgi:predicted nucleotidyltransferase
MSLPKNLLLEHPSLNQWAILSAYRGSIAHGMYVPKSDPNSIDDKDVMAICVPPIEYYFGLQTFGSNGTKEIKQDEWDIVVYEARKFIRLLELGNPNVLMMLWLEPNYLLKKTAAGQLILSHRSLFVGRHVYKSFVGYAHGQLHRMTHGARLGHMGAKRKALMDQYGYDCKNAAHLIRLLRMGVEFLKDGELQVLRHDATQLLEIKTGKWTLDQVQDEAKRWFALAEQAYIQSSLPAHPDHDQIGRLCIDVIQTALDDWDHCED